MMFTKKQIIRWLQLVTIKLSQNQDLLTDLDAAIGDADHGVNLVRGFTQVANTLPTMADAEMGGILKMAAMTVMSAVGGASGLLYGNFLLRAALNIGEKTELDADGVLHMLESGRDGIVHRGRANLGDKTMIDAWSPALAAFAAALQPGVDLPTALHACAAAAEQGMLATIPMQAKKGRASYMGERSIGHQDPGATSTFLILRALADAVSEDHAPQANE